MNNQTICINSKVNGKQPSLQDRVYSTEGCDTAITTGFYPSIAVPLRIPQAAKQGYIEVQEGGVFDGSYPNSTTRRGRVQDGGEVSPALLTSGDNINRYEGMQVEQIDDKVVETTYRIRKLTPRECFRLMGVEDKDIDTIQASGVSNSQQYKMAGNSIVVDCLYHLFRKMFTETQSEDRQLTLF